MDSTAIVLIGLFFLGVNIPCATIIYIGMRYFNMMGRYPSKTPKIQMNTIMVLAMTEVITFTILLALFKVLSPES